ncbi:MAG: PIG-L family deacetylase [Verrucomicrobia bacterium]|nr:PIG-L family deacetylase [Verrucomicrobiota bacterium]
MTTMNPYQQFVSTYARLAREGRGYPLGTFSLPARSSMKPGAPVVMIFSPHPDDEVIIGGLAVRLMREAGWRVVNVAVTQGSKKERQQGRLEELRRCCEYIGFDLVQTTASGLERINPKTRDRDGAHWGRCVGRIAEIVAEHRPRAILLPHDEDWNSTHVGTHHLVVDALRQLGDQLSCYTVETEFWGQMAAPNLMVELSEAHLSDMITALTFHVGEVERNPYHLSLPAWMIDNVRRGAELVGGQGGASPDFIFATLYRVRGWRGGEWSKCHEGGRNLGCAESAAALFAGA